MSNLGKTTIITIMIIIFAIITYLIVAFGQWELNPGMWSDSTRIGTAIALSITLMLGAVVGYGIADNIVIKKEVK